ncbi:MAG: efflux RND transporter periplasmic adaptor subunit, partial [Lentisphaerae bacterium]|nr:efflux RND transporter periplasmic adaptor subunit [Lentisphaerota bacterium]
VLPGHKVMPSEPLMVVGDLTRVWGDADIYASDLPYVKTGMPVALTLPYWPANVFTGAVSFITPTLDPETRTMRARLEIDNSNVALKPEMYADAHLRYELGERLVVPEQAVMRTGLHNYAFREGDGGKLIPTELTLGTRGDGYIEVVSGLKAGDKVVTSANFLVDSESSNTAAMEALTQ